MEIGPAAQHRVVRKLLDHLTGQVIDGLEDDRRRGAVEKRLVRKDTRLEFGKSLRLAVLGSVGVTL